MVAVSACAALAWSGWSLWLFPLSFGLPLFLGLCDTRLSAMLVACGYFGTALAPCIRGSQVFFEQRSPFGGLLLWMTWTILLAGIFAVCWHPQAGWRVALTGVGLIVHSLLPIGLASPLTAAGVLFPGTGFLGLMLILILFIALAGRFWKTSVLLFLTAAICQVRFSPARPIPSWHAVNTSFGGSALQSQDPRASYQRLVWLSARAKASPGQLLLFPEDSLRDYSDGVTGEWLDLPAIAAAGTTIVIGSDRPGQDFHHRENVLLMRGALSGEYRQRVPIPVAMWGRDTDAHLFGPGTVLLASHRAAVLLCYEQLLVLPVLESFLGRSDVLLASSNLHWAREINVDAVEGDCVRAWARLFAVPYLRAVNR